MWASFTITPFEYKDMDNASQPKFDALVIKIDCNVAMLKTYVKSGNVPVQGTITFLKVTKYEQPFIGSGTTDANGFVSYRIPGSSRTTRLRHARLTILRS